MDVHPGFLLAFAAVWSDWVLYPGPGPADVLQAAVLSRATRRILLDVVPWVAEAVLRFVAHGRLPLMRDRSGLVTIVQCPVPRRWALPPVSPGTP